MARLGQALAADVQNGARLEVPEGLPNGYQGIVVLSLPATLPQRLQEEAGKLGLSREASVADLRVVLRGAGYTITPAGYQTQRLSAGEPPRLTWRVSETADSTVAREPLSAEINAELKGAGRPLSFPLATIAAVPAPLATETEDKAKAPAFLTRQSFALAIPLLLILIAIFILARWAKARQRERERRRAHLEQFRT